MRARITLKQVVRVVKLSVLPLWFWPLPQNASKSKIVCMKLYHCVSAILAGILATSMIYSLLNNLHDPYLVVQSAFPLFPSIHVILNTFNHEFIYQRLQVINMWTLRLRFFFFFKYRLLFKFIFPKYRTQSIAVNFTSYAIKRIYVINCSTLLSKWRDSAS